MCLVREGNLLPTHILGMLLIKYSFVHLRYKINKFSFNLLITFIVLHLLVYPASNAFNSYYDKGIYEFPIEQKNRTHPNQKNLKLFESLILKHSKKISLQI